MDELKINKTEILVMKSVLMKRKAVDMTGSGDHFGRGNKEKHL